MPMDYAKTANSNNRKLQEGIGFKSDKTFKPETRKIREFPTVHPKEAAAFRSKIQKEARRQKVLNIVLFTVIFLIVSWALYTFNYS
jgi:hypothetical protein